MRINLLFSLNCVIILESFSGVKEFMESLMKGEIQAFLEEREGSRNGYYERDLGTRYGKINEKVSQSMAFFTNVRGSFIFIELYFSFNA